MRHELIALVLFVGCKDPTEVRLQLTTDVACSVVGAHGALVRSGPVGQAESREPAATATSCSAGGALGDVVFVPSGNGDAFEISVVLGVDKPSEACDLKNPAGCIVARRRISFLPSHPLTLPVDLRAACAGVACPADQTCVDGACKSATVDPNQCVGSSCALDAGSPAEAGVDASAPDASCGDVLVDLKNCGKCGFDCGGLCVQGICQLTPMSVAKAGACIGANKDGVWLTGGTAPGSLLLFPISGGAPFAKAMTSTSVAIEATDTDVLYGNQLAVGSINAGSPTWAPLTLGTPPVIGLATNATSLVALTTTSFSVCGLASTCATSGGARGTPVPPYSGVTLLPTQYFATVPAANALAYGPTGAGMGNSHPDTGQPNAIVSDGVDALYWARSGTGEIVTASAGAPMFVPQVLATNQTNPRHLALDAAHKLLFWTTSATSVTGAVMRLDLAAPPGAKPTSVATKLADANCVAVYGGAVFWTSGGFPYKAPERVSAAPWPPRAPSCSRGRRGCARASCRRAA